LNEKFSNCDHFIINTIFYQGPYSVNLKGPIIKKYDGEGPLAHGHFYMHHFCQLSSIAQILSQKGRKTSSMTSFRMIRMVDNAQFKGLKNIY